MTPPLSISWRSRTGEPVSCALWMSPSPWRMSARAASITSEPWTMCTLPVSTQGPPSVTVQSLRSACTRMVCWRSEDLATAACAQHAAATARTSLAVVRVIGEAHVGQELDALAGQVGLHPGTAHCSAGAGDGHHGFGGGQVVLWMHVQLLGADHGRAGGAGGAVGDDVAAQLYQGALLVHPSGLRAHFPAAALFVGHQEQRRGQLQGARAGRLAQLGRAQRERFLAAGVQGDHFEIAQHEIRTRIDRILDRHRLVFAPREPAAEQGAGEQDQDQREAPVHRTGVPSRLATAPWACRTRSHSSRAAPSPPREGVTQWTASRSQWCTLAGATAKPTSRSTARSGRSSPMNATCAISRPRSAASPRTQASLSLQSTCAARPSSLARLAATRLSRAVT